MDGEILRSIRKSPLRRDVLKYLGAIYPDKAYPDQIGRDIDKLGRNILGCLVGMPTQGYAPEYSLVSLNLVTVIEKSGKKYYQLNRPFADEVLELINEKRRVEVEI